MITDSKLISKDQAKTIVSNLMIGLSSIPRINQYGGCGRCYVNIGYTKLLKSSALAKELIAQGFKLTTRPYSKGLYLYVGYDNATSIQWSKAERIAALLNENGVVAYADGDSD